MKKNASVVIVNSDPDVLKVLSEALGSNSNVSTYTTFSEAEKDLCTKKAPDLIVLDIHIEDASIWTVCSILKSKELKKVHSVPVMATSSILSEEEFHHCFKVLNVNGFASLKDDSWDFSEKVELLSTTHTAPPESIVLIVDDNKSVVHFYTRSISFSGHTVLQAYNISSALRIIRNKKPHVVLLDHRFRGENGFALINEMKKDGLCAIIIVVTGDHTPGLAREYSRLGADAFANKPIEPTYLTYLINNAYSQRSKSYVETLLLKKMKEMKSSMV